METRPSPFNSPVDVGLRSLTILSQAFPVAYVLDRLVIFDYFIVHSGDLPGGPESLHPNTPHRSGEILVRRELISSGLRLLESRDLVATYYGEDGISFVATEIAGAFLDALDSTYARDLRERADWVVARYGNEHLGELRRWVSDHLGDWGGEFEVDAILNSEDR